MGANAALVLEILNGSLILVSRYSQAAAAQGGLLANAQAEGRDITDEELAQARAFNADRGTELDQAIEARRKLEAERAGG